MEAFVAITIVAFVCYCAYRSGKRDGSRKGFAVGRFRR